MLIRVIYADKRIGLIDVRNLSDLIVGGNILAFRRLDGWARIGIDPMRGFGGEHCGSERRTRDEQEEVHAHFPKNVNGHSESIFLSRQATAVAARV